MGEDRAIDAHFNVGRKVRNTVSELGGAMSENLPPEPSIKKLISKHIDNIIALLAYLTPFVILMEKN